MCGASERQEGSLCYKAVTNHKILFHHGPSSRMMPIRFKRVLSEGLNSPGEKTNLAW